MAGPEAAKKYQNLIFLAGSASAEFFADIALCPMEAVKVGRPPAFQPCGSAGTCGVANAGRLAPRRPWPALDRRWLVGQRLAGWGPAH